MPRKPRDAGSDGIDEVIEWFEASEEPTSGQPSAASAEAATQTEAGRPPASGTGPSPALRRWARLVRSIWSIRKLQRIYHNTGERLKDFPKPLREEISKRFPKQ